jgi:hypothetical protein
MQTATKESDRPGSGGGLNWRQRKKINDRRQEAIKWRNDLIDAYVAALGGPDRVSAITRQDCERAADMAILALNLRRRALRGDASVAISDLTRVEGCADRAVRRLNLPPPNAAAPVPTLADYLAGQHEEDG